MVPRTPAVPHAQSARSSSMRSARASIQPSPAPEIPPTTVEPTQRAAAVTTAHASLRPRIM